MAKLWTFLFCILAVVPAFGQQDSRVTGRVQDSDGNPIFGANVVIEGSGLKGGKVGQITDVDGSYSISALPSGNYILRVTHVGYDGAEVEEEITLANGSVLKRDIRLQETVILMGQSVVSASRKQEKILDAPASVAIVNADEIRGKPALTVADHIRDLPAVDFSQTGIAQSNVVVRGFNNIFSGSLLTLTDNRIARVPSLRFNAYNFIPVTNSDIGRIEVVLGPGAALYGPNSANGVMHIITRSPLDEQGTEINFGVGERSVAKFGFRHAGKISNRLGYKISAQQHTGTDWKYTDPGEQARRDAAIAGGADADAVRIGARDFDLSRQSAELRFDYRHSEDLTVIVSGGYNDASNIEMTGIGAGLADGWKGGYYQGRMSYKGLFFQAYQNWTDSGDTFLLQSGGPIIDKSTLSVYQLQHSYQLGDRQSFTYGADVLRTRPDTEGSINGANENDDDINEFGIYLQSETALTEQFELVLAGRYDDHNRVADAQYSPRAALVYKPTETQTLRLTFNSAYSTPGNNSMYLDLRQAVDPYGLGNFGLAPIDIRAQGTYQSGSKGGFSFSRSDDNRPQFRTPLSAVAGLDLDHYWNMGDPTMNAIMWGTARQAVLAGFVPQFTAIATGSLQAQGLDEATAAATAAGLAQLLPNLIPEQLAGLDNTLMTFDGVGGFNPADDVADVPMTPPTTTETLELGYKGVLGNKLVVAADAYSTTTKNFVGSIGIETPNVFLDPATLGVALTEGITAAMSDPSNADVAAAVTALDAESLGGNGNGSAVDEVVAQVVNGAARVPLGTVSPNEANDPLAVIGTYRSFGEVKTSGLDVRLAYYASDELIFSGGMSFVDENYFSNVDGVGDISLNAPKIKFNLGGSYAFNDEINFGARMRYNGGFDANSGYYSSSTFGPVEAYTVLDVNAGYRLPVEYDMLLTLNVSNVLNNEHREFVGAPEIGRLAILQLGASF